MSGQDTSLEEQSGVSSPEPGFVQETLDWCNERRAEKGKEPLDRLPKGQRFDADSCPCGKACGLQVYSRFYVLEGQELDYSNLEGNPRLPEAVQRFVSAFDSGELPQYDEDVSV